MWGEQSFGSDLSWLAHVEFFFFPFSRKFHFCTELYFFFFFFVSYNKSEPSPPAQNQAIQFRGFVFGRGMYGV